MRHPRADPILDREMMRLITLLKEEGGTNLDNEMVRLITLLEEEGGSLQLGPQRRLPQ